MLGVARRRTHRRPDREAELQAALAIQERIEGLEGEAKALKARASDLRGQAASTLREYEKKQRLVLELKRRSGFRSTKEREAILKDLQETESWRRKLERMDTISNDIFQVKKKSHGRVCAIDRRLLSSSSSLSGHCLLC